MRKDWAILALISILTTSLVFIWKGAEYPWDSPVGLELITQFRAWGVGSLSDKFSSMAELAAEFGWSAIARIAPFSFVYVFFGSLGLLTLIFVFTVLTLALVYLIAEEYSTSEVALLAAFVFALSPLIIKFPLDALSLFSSGFISLFAVFMAINGARVSVPAQKIVFWSLCALACVVNLYLVDWGIWLPVFVALATLLPRLTSSQARFLVFSVLLIWLLTGFQQVVHNDLAFDSPPTLFGEFMLMPKAFQTGYSEIIPIDIAFNLPGNNPAVILALASLVMIAKEKRRLWSSVALWFLVGLGFNFWFFQEGNEEIFIIFMLPMALLIANFFAPLQSPSKLIGAATLPLLFFSVLGSMEPSTSEVVVSLQFPGWMTAVPFRDLGQILAGLLPVTVFYYIFLEDKFSPRGRSLYLGVVFMLFGLSQIGLMALL